MTPGIVSTYARPRERYQIGQRVWIKGSMSQALVVGDSGETVAVLTPGVVKICLPKHVSATGPVTEVVG